MEAPKPISLLTPAKPENDLTLLDKKEFKLSNEKVEYIIEIGKLSSTENLGIKLKENTSSTKVYYSNNFNLEELRNIHKYFRFFDNINEAVSNIQEIFEEKKVNIKLENGNIFLILKIPKIGKDEDLISIELSKKSLSLEELNENLSKEVSELKNKIELLNKENKKRIELLEKKHKNEIDELKNKITSLDSKINEILNWLNKIEGKEKEKEKKQKDEKNDKNKIDSKIITSKEELDFITNRLKQIDYFKNKNLSFGLVFRGQEMEELQKFFIKNVMEHQKQLQ